MNSDRVLVVYNANSADSRAVADYYLLKRGIPAANLCAITAPTDVGFVDYATYLAQIKTPVLAALTALGRTNILFIVSTHGVPFVVYDARFQGNARAVDSLLAMPFVADDHLQSLNPYQAGDQSGANIYTPFQTLDAFRTSHPTYPLVYAVGRLDGASAAIARAQVDNALIAERDGLHGIGAFDARYDVAQPFDDGSYLAGDWEILRAWQMWSATGRPSIADRHASEFGGGDAPHFVGPTAWYWAWYEGYHLDAFTFVPGAIGCHLDSSSAINIYGAGNFVGDAIARGITAASGAVAEPFLNGLPHGDTVLRSLLSGATLGEALARGLEYFCWMTTNVGDPLYTPFPGSVPPVIPMTIPAIPPPPPSLPDGSATAVFTRVDTTSPPGAEGARRPTDVSVAASSPFTIRSGVIYSWNPTTSAWYGDVVTIDVRTPSAQPHQLAVYLLDFDHGGRSVNVDVLDAGGAILDSRVVTDFNVGKWLVYNVTGIPTVRVTKTAGVNAVVSGVYLDAVAGTPPPPPPADTLASLVTQLQALATRFQALVSR